LKAMKRVHDVAAVEEAVRTAVSIGFRPVVDVVGELPGEEEDAASTVKEMEKLISRGLLCACTTSSCRRAPYCGDEDQPRRIRYTATSSNATGRRWRATGRSR